MSRAILRISGIMKAEPMIPTVEFGDRHVDGAQLAEVCRRYGVKELCLFGSAARGSFLKAILRAV